MGGDALALVRYRLEWTLTELGYAFYYTFLGCPTTEAKTDPLLWSSLDR
jgi:hypothetical protein